MKNARAMRAFSMAVILLLVACCVDSLSAAQQNRDPAAQRQQQKLPSTEEPQPPDSMDQELEARTFTGKIMKSGEKLVLKNAATQSSYALDDQERAESFEGRNVKVMGTLDPLTGTLRIKSIEIETGN